jgi:ATP-dependent RNA helicase DDX10/DBP4
LIENLYRKKWTTFDGLGALILSPSRELALVGLINNSSFSKYLKFSELLQSIIISHVDWFILSIFKAKVVGGNKKVEEEKKFIIGMNILVATPGRFLQHLDETYGFSCDNLQILVLDEAGFSFFLLKIDRLLELGFEKEVNAIIKNLPKERQTLVNPSLPTHSSL